MKGAKDRIWLNSERCLCELNEDGSVTFVKDITEKELRWLVTALMVGRDIENQRRLDDMRDIDDLRLDDRL